MIPSVLASQESTIPTSNQIEIAPICNLWSNSNEDKVPRQRIRNSEAENLWSYKMDWELKVEETGCFVHLGFSQLLSPVWKYLGHTLIFKGGENWANISCLPLFSTVLASIK